MRPRSKSPISERPFGFINHKKINVIGDNRIFREESGKDSSKVILTGDEARILDIPNVAPYFLNERTYEALLDRQGKVPDLVQSRDIETSA